MLERHVDAHRALCAGEHGRGKPSSAVGRLSQNWPYQQHFALLARERDTATTGPQLQPYAALAKARAQHALPIASGKFSIQLHGVLYVRHGNDRGVRACSRLRAAEQNYQLARHLKAARDVQWLALVRCA